MSSRFLRPSTSLFIGLVAALFFVTTPADAQGKPDFDVRGSRATTLPTLATKLPPGQQRALDDLRASVDGKVVVQWSPLTGAPSRIHFRGKPLTLPSQAAPQAIANTFLAQYRQLMNLSPEDMRDLRFSRDFRTEHNGASHLTLQQRVEGRDVFGGGIKINLDAQGRILGISGEPMPNVNAKVNAINPTISEHDALYVAATAAGVVNQRSSKIHGLVYFPVNSESVRLAWRVYVEDDDTPDAYESLVDAVDGTLLWRKNLTLYNHIPAHGDIFPSDSPLPNTPAGTLFTDSRDDVLFNGGAFFPHGDPHYDWWNGATRDTTTGNNVDAFLDRINDDAPDASCATCSGVTTGRPLVVGEDFSSPIDLLDEPDQYQDAAVINLFYWNNRIHDFFYRIGFDEVSGNFQTSNFAFGGVGGDALRANAQDGRDDTDPPLCNANMNTGADGSAPRMQMYLCNGVSPERDGDLEAVVIGHEYAHGVHARLVPLSGRQNPQEGISDYFGLSLVAEAADPFGGAYGIGDYLFGINSGNGIRSSPYSTDSAIFPRTYADINDASSCQFGTCSVTTGTLCDEDADCPATETCGNVPVCSFDEDCDSPPQTIGDRGPCRVSVHHTGELWANALWIGRMNLIEKHGFTNGARIMNRLVIDGMKLSPDNPSMLDGRDAILAADEATNGGSNVCLLWDAFAQMGMGFSALTTGNDDLNPLEAFDLPSECTPVFQYNTVEEFGNVCIGDFEAETLTIFNTGSGDLVISSVSRTAGSTDITVDATPTTPVVVGASAHIEFTVRCTPTTEGAKTATITIATNDPAQPSVDIEYTCNGGEANLVTTFASNGSFGNVCLGNDKDLELTLHNSGSCALSIATIGSNNAEFEVGAVQTLPLVIAAGDTVMVPIQFDPAGDTGTENANITITSNDPDTPHVLAVTGNSPAATLDAFIVDTGAFGDVCADTLKDLAVTVQNNGACPLLVTGTALVGGQSGDFQLPTGVANTLLEPLNSVVFPVRFAPTDFLPLLPSPRSTTFRASGRTQYASSTLTDKDVTITGVVPPPDINVPAATATVEFGNVCATETAEQDIPVCNTGLCTLNVTSASLGACDDFTIVQNPFPSLVSHDFCMSVRVRYTPTEEGEHSCTLTILSDDPDESPVLVNLHGTTPTTDINIPESLYFAPEVVQTIDACSTFKKYPVSNKGICPLSVTNMEILIAESEDPYDFGLDGLPSFPIILQTGHIAGEGDLEVEFAPYQDPLPNHLDRDNLATLAVTYISDSVLLTETTVDVPLCGESVLTGARVLVTNHGTPLGVVERIQIQRITANRNRRPQLDSISVLQNVPLNPVDLDAPCQDFEYHSEYGTVANPLQLLPGVYQVNATIRVNGRRYTKSVGFSVNACDFNPTVVVTFATP